MIDILPKKHPIVDSVLMPKKPLIMDIGANKGVFSNYILKQRPYACIHMYEPLNEMYYYLRGKFEGMNNVHIHRRGILGESYLKPQKLYINTKTRGNLDYTTHFYEYSSFMDNRNDIDRNKYQEVKVNGINEEIRKLKVDYIDILKLDVEGGEIDILKNLSNKYMSRIYQITVEYHIAGADKIVNKHTINEVEKHLSPYFKLYKMEDKHKEYPNRCYVNQRFRPWDK